MQKKQPQRRSWDSHRNSSKYLLKTGIKLPKNEQANDFLRNNLHGDLEKSDVNTEIINFQSIIYDFFAHSY